MTEELDWELSKLDPWYFLRRMVKTKNEHTGLYEPFPLQEAPRFLIRVLQSEPRVLIAKSRQLMASWVVMCWLYWSCLTRNAERCAVQSEKEEKAWFQMERVVGVHSRMPAWFQKRFPVEATVRPPTLRFPTTDSSIHGLAQGPDQARSMPFSKFFADEVAFQEEAASSYGIILPTLGETGQYIGVSTVAPGFFEQMVKDQW